MKKHAIAFAVFFLATFGVHAQSCVTLTLQGSFPDPMPITNPITVVTVPLTITNACPQTIYFGKYAWSGLESADDTKYIANGCTSVPANSDCTAEVQAWGDPDDPNICQPPNAPGESFCVDTLTLTWCFVKPCPGANNQSPAPTVTFQWTVDNPKVQGDVEPASIAFSGPVGVPTADQTITGSNSETCGADCTGMVTFGQVTTPSGIFIDQDNCSGQSIPQSQTCTVTVYAIPTTATHTSLGPICIPSNLGNSGRHKIYLTVN